jgi:dienelactone hydrolase
MVTEKGQAKIMDFGLAKMTGEVAITKEVKTMGTVAYMSPEQARGEPVDHRTDIWSMGVVLYEMFSGRLPFQGERETSILYSIVHEEPKRLKAINPAAPPEIERVIQRALAKNPESRYASAADLAYDLEKYQQNLRALEAGFFNLKSLARRLRKPRIALLSAIVLIGLVSLTVWFFNRQAKIRWAKGELLPKINELYEAGFENYVDAYKLATEAEKYLPHDPRLAEVLSKISLPISIKTEPAGAKVFMKGYNAPDREWQYLGLSPIEKIRLPIGFFRWKMEKEGYETVLAAATTHKLNFSEKWIFAPCDMMRGLDKRREVPAGMVRVQGMEDVPGIGRIGDFFLDRYEVANRQYKEFVDRGGYQNKEYWKQKFIKEGKEVSWEEALKGFVDQTGRSGPSAWQAGDYPEGQDDFPVSGISWYEAAAYAESVGKSLPTSHHWGIACGEYTSTPGWWNYISLLAPLSNFKGRGPVRVGSFAGMTAFGNYDMAGNVREWCWNETPQGRIVRGGAWDDANYMFAYLNQASPFERSAKTGFRCARYIDKKRIPGSAFAAVHPEERHDLEKMKPAADAVFQVYKEMFLYDKTDLHARLERRNENSSDWNQEKVTFAAAYGNERVIAYLFLPKKSRPPYQTVIFYPGSAVESATSSNSLEKDFQFDLFLSFIVKNGRAVLYPVLKGTFERGDWVRYQVIDSDISTREFSEWVIMQIKDFFRCLDYLETRSDIDHQKFAYMGYSAGAWIAPYILALDYRIKASILQNGGFMIYFLGTGPIRPEMNQMNFVTRVKTPTLMLNGRYDVFFPYETNARIMFERLGTPRDQKEQKIYNSDHYVPRSELIKETLRWLDRYLGPVR